jgi:hypothetical protein
MVDASAELRRLARGQWTNHSGDCQGELLALLKDASQDIWRDQLHIISEKDAK